MVWNPSHEDRSVADPDAGTATWTPACACGWRAEPVADRKAATKAYRIHLRRARHFGRHAIH